MPEEPGSPLVAREPVRPDLGKVLSTPPVATLRGRNLTKATVYFHRQGELAVAVKSYAGSPWLIRNLIGRWLIRREAAAYRAAAAIDGLPHCFGRIGPFALATEWIEAEQLASKEKQSCRPALFDRIGAILDELHRRGVALADLHHRDVLVSEDSSVYLIDLATAWCLGKRPGWLRRVVFARLKDADRVALARMRARFTGTDEAAAIAAVGAGAAAWHRRGRRIKAVINRLRGKR